MKAHLIYFLAGLCFALWGAVAMYVLPLWVGGPFAVIGLIASGVFFAASGAAVDK